MNIDITPEALKAMIHEAVAKTDSQTLPGTSMTLDSLFAEWMEAKRLEVSGNTISKYEILYGNHVKPIFGSKNLTDLTKPMLQSFINSLTDRGYAVETVKAIKSSVLNAPLKYAEEEGYIGVNPCQSVKTPKRTYTNHKNAANAKDFKKLLQIALKKRLWIALLLLFDTGMRRGELLALKWTDIDFKKSTIHIRQSYSANCKTGKAVLKDPKTAGSYRVIRMLPGLKEHLRRYQRQQGNGFTFVISQEGVDSPMNPCNFSRMLRSWCIEAGVNGITSHIGRHTFAVRLHQLGFDATTIMQFTGHTDSRTLEKYYLDKDAPDSPIIRQAVRALNGDLFSQFMTA